MFELALKQNLERIFDTKKVTFNAADPEALEQDTLFVDIERGSPRVKDGRVTAKVMGKAFIFAQNNKIPFGYFAKYIDKAPADLTAPFFFYDLEENLKVNINLVRRGFSFVYFFNGQYDPDLGNITSIDFEG